MSLITVKNLKIHYNTPRGIVKAVDDVSFEIFEEETLGLVGESGCGKSTLGMGLLDILPPSAEISGEIVLKGENILDKDPDSLRTLRHEQIALIFQDPMTRLDPLMRIKDHFLETFRAHRPDITDEEATKISKRLLKAVGIPEDRFEYYPHEFSGGMRQRIMIALGLIFNPLLLVADEPTTSLDVIVEAQILQLINKLKKEFHMSVVLITHNLGIVAEMANRVAVMYAGRIVELAPAISIFQSSFHPYTQGLLGSVITLESKELVTLEGAPPDLVNPPIGCRFEPRCAFAFDRCKIDEPEFVKIEDDHYVACFKVRKILTKEAINNSGDVSEKVD